MTEPIDLGFQDFQHAFARHIRDPRHAPRPAGVPARPMGLYNTLLFNNISGFIDRCFPVCRAVLGEARWRRLNRHFFRDWPLLSPWFRDIPGDFARYLSEGAIRTPSPRWLPELAQYEWLELAVDIADAPLPECDPAASLLDHRVVLNPTLQTLDCAWPVHRIGPHYRPRKPVPTHLVVYRAPDDTVQFAEITPVTARLLALLLIMPNGNAALLQIAEELAHPAPEQLRLFGLQLLENLRAQSIILGTTH